MRVLFVYTVSNDLPPPKKPLADWFEISLAISYLSASLEEQGHETSLLVLRHGSFKRQMEHALVESQPALICFSAVATEYSFVEKVARFVSKRVPACYQVIGGAHPSLRPDDVMRGPFDAVCISEGEGALVELAAALEAGKTPSHIENLWIRHGETIEKNPTRPFPAGIDELPFPSRAMWEPFVEFPEKHAILLGRGCPFLCSYCANHALRKLAEGKYVRLRSPENVLQELCELCEEFPRVTYVYFEIETISADQEWAFEFAALLEQFNAERSQPLDFALNLRIHHNVSFRRLFQALKRAGFTYIRTGIESGSERVRNEILERHESNQDIIRAFDDARDVGLETYAYNLIGLPGETPEDFMQTVELNRRCAPTRSYIGIFYPYPGTGLERVCAERGIRVPPLVDSAERYRARLNLPEFPNRLVEHYFRKFPQLVSHEKQPLFERVDSYVWQTLVGFPRIHRSVRRLTGHGVLTKLRRTTRSMASMFPRDS